MGPWYAVYIARISAAAFHNADAAKWQTREAHASAASALVAVQHVLSLGTGRETTHNDVTRGPRLPAGIGKVALQEPRQESTTRTSKGVFLKLG